MSVSNRLPRLTQCREEACAIVRLQEKIDRVYIECVDGVLIERGDKNHFRHSFRSYDIEHTEPVKLGHLHVQENDVRFLFLNEAHGFQSAFAFTDKFKIGLLTHQPPQSL